MGYLFQGNILASYATGALNGGSGNRSYAGGLVGVMGASGDSTLTASYATGNSQWRGWVLRTWWVAWWAGSDGTSTITASYATGNSQWRKWK